MRRRKFVSTNQKHYPYLGSDASSAWNFCARFSDVISRENHWRREMSAVFSGHKTFYFIFFMAQKNGVPAMLRAEDKLRQALEPAHIQLLSQISKLQGGVKDIVDMRNDLLVR